MKLKALGVVHENCAYCEIDGEYVIEGDHTRHINGNEEVFIKVMKDYKILNPDEWWQPKWESIKPLDKDEITILHLVYEDETIDIRVPYKNVSDNGSYCVNEYSLMSETDDEITIVWRNY